MIYDITPPTLSFISPDPNEWINHQRMEMSTNEPIQKWSIKLNWKGGVFDDNAPYYFEFLDTVQVSEKKDLAAYFTLNDGSMYTFEMIGSDLAGNISYATTIDSITYDITPPIITMIYPFDDEAINNPTVSYAISEQLLLGEILWTQVDGMEDTLSPHIVNMIEDELSPVEKIRINMVNEPILMDGSIYTLTVNGRDLASNDSETIVVSNILYDTTPPSFSNIKPDSGSALNHQRITYSVSEDLFKGEVIWMQTGGTNDPDAPHKVQFEGSELKFGDHNDITLLNICLLYTSPSPRDRG